MAGSSAVKIAYRIFSWSTLIVLAVALVLVLRKSEPPNVPYDRDATARVQQKFAAADQAKAAGQPAAVQLDRTELNSYLKDNLGLEGAASPVAEPANSRAATPGDAGSSDPATRAGSFDPATVEQVQSTVKDVKIDMDGDLAKAYVVFDLHGKDLSLELDGHLGAQDGYIRFQPVAGKLGYLPLPQWTLETAVEKLMTSAENRDKLKLPPDISDIQIANGQVVVTYK
jgi:hypothetical protein